MRTIEKLRQEYQALPKRYYHLCTDGWKEGVLFGSDQQFAAGVTSIAMSTLKYDIVVYAYVLMPNHIHLLLSGTGKDCVSVFDYMMRRCALILKHDDDPPLPKGYGFKLIPIDSQESFRSHLLYLARNPYEKGYGIPGSYPWGSDYLLYNPLGSMLRGERAGSMSYRRVSCITGCADRLPPDWEIHMEFGILPKNFVPSDKARSLFPSPKAYISRLVKDYEALLHISGALEEGMEWSEAELDDIFYSALRNRFPGKTALTLDMKEKYQLATFLSNKYGLTVKQLAPRLRLGEYALSQALNAKERW